MIRSILLVMLSTLLISTTLADDPRATRRVPGDHPIIKENGKIFIQDRKGEKWDITSAVKKYGMDPKFFNFGLGRNVFKPILHPEHRSKPPHFSNPQVFGIEYLDKTVAYNRRTLTKDETLMDTYKGEPVFVAFCYLADLAGLYSRVVDGQTLTLVASGWTYHNGHHNTFVVYDKETNSLWFPFSDRDHFVAIGGKLEGKKLEEIGFLERTSWKNWKLDYPDSTYVE